MYNTMRPKCLFKSKIATNCFFFAAIACLLIGCGQQKRPNPSSSGPVARQLPAGVVARAESDSVTADQFRTSVKAALWVDRATTVPEGSQAIDWVGRMLAGRAFQREADRLGAQSDPGYKAAIKLAVIRRMGMMTAGDMQYDIYSPDPPADTQNKLYEYYKRLAYIPEIRFNYIFLRTTGMTPEQKAAKRAQAEEIRRRVTTGKEDFYAVLDKVSEAPNKKGDNYTIDPTMPGLDPKMWDRLAAIKPQTVSEIVESADGYYIFRVDRSTVMRPEANFAGFDLGEVDRFFFTKLFKHPINPFFLEYQARTPVYLKSPSEPMPPADAVLVEVGSQKLTLAEINAARAFYGEAPLEQRGLIKEIWTDLQFMTLAERTRRLGLAEATSGSLEMIDDLSSINQAFIRKKKLAELGEPTAAQINKYFGDWKKANGTLPVVAGWRLKLKPAKEAPPTPLELRAEIDDIHKRLEAGEAADKLAAGYKKDKFKLEVTRQDATILELLLKENPAWPSAPLMAGKPMLSAPVQQPDGFAIYIVTERRPGNDWKLEPLKPMLNELWRQEQAQSALNAIAKGVQDTLEVDQAQIKAIAGQKAQLLAALPPPLKKK